MVDRTRLLSFGDSIYQVNRHCLRNHYFSIFGEQKLFQFSKNIIHARQVIVRQLSHDQVQSSLQETTFIFVVMMIFIIYCFIYLYFISSCFRICEICSFDVILYYSLLLVWSCGPCPTKYILTISSQQMILQSLLNGLHKLLTLRKRKWRKNR